MLSQAQRTAILELSAKGVTKRQIARVLQLSRLTVRKVLRANSTHVPEIQRAEKAEPYRQQILDLLTSCKGNLVRVHEELKAGGRGAVVSGADRILPPARHWTNTGRARGPVSLRAGRGNAARYVSARSRSGWQEIQGADRLGGAVLFAHAVLPDQPHIPEVRLQGVSHRCAALYGRRSRARDDRQHTCGSAAWHGKRNDPRARNGGVWRTLRIPLRGA